MEYIDKSNKSILLGVFTGTVFLYIFYRIFTDNKQYIFDKVGIELTDIKLYILSLVLSLIITFVILVLFKEYLKKAGESTFLMEPFEQKHHSSKKSTTFS